MAWLDWRGLSAHKRLLAALIVFVATALLLPSALTYPVRFAASWDAGVVAFLALTWVVVQACPATSVRQTVLANDQGRNAILVIVLFAIAASIAAIFFLLEKPKQAGAAPLPAQVALAILTIACSWLLTHVMFALHYAHRFYRDDPSTPEKDATGGLKFPGSPSPLYWDFVYFSFVIGMTSQVSDVQVTSLAMRHLVLWHGVLSFAFYTVILALTINIVAGLL